MAAVFLEWNDIVLLWHASFIIFSDSMSSLEVLKGFKLESDLVQNVIKDYTHLMLQPHQPCLCQLQI